MDIWNFDQLTGELISKGTADPDQLDPGNWLYPAHSTTVMPPAAVAGYARVYQGGAWTLVEDHRGEVWWTVDGRRVEITDLGDPHSAGLLSSEPHIDRPPEPQPVIVLTRRQFYQALAMANYITEAEAIAAMAGTIPAALSAAIDALTDPQERFTARMLLAGAAEFRRDHPLVSIIGAAHGQSAAQIDGLFAAAAML